MVNDQNIRGRGLGPRLVLEQVNTEHHLVRVFFHSSIKLGGNPGDGRWRGQIYFWHLALPRTMFRFKSVHPAQANG